MSAAAALSEARARLALAFPGWSDATGDPHAIPETALPAFAVRLSVADGPRDAMGATTFLRDGVLSVALWIAPPAALPSFAEEAAHAQAAVASAALLAAPADLGGAVWDLSPGSVDVDHAAGEGRISRADLALPVQINN